MDETTTDMIGLLLVRCTQQRIVLHGNDRVYTLCIRLCYVSICLVMEIYQLV